MSRDERSSLAPTVAYHAPPGVVSQQTAEVDGVAASATPWAPFASRGTGSIQGMPEAAIGPAWLYIDRS
ncbi:MAG TPA: hypothetical protein VIK11_13920 [Tepidiformaceae bacterium]